MLNAEYKDTIDSIRAIFGNFMGWFSFFTTVNLAGYGWFTKQLIDNPAAARWLILIVCVYFVFQHGFAWFATEYLLNYLKKSEARLGTVLAELTKEGPSGLQPKVGCPVGLYIQFVRSAKTTYPTMAALWIAFTIFAFLGRTDSDQVPDQVPSPVPAQASAP